MQWIRCALLSLAFCCSALALHSRSHAEDAVEVRHLRLREVTAGKVETDASRRHGQASHGHSPGLLQLAKAALRKQRDAGDAAASEVLVVRPRLQEERGKKTLARYWWGCDVVAGLFMVGLVLVLLEDKLRINKSAVTLTIAGLMWTVLAFDFERMLLGRAQREFERDIGRGLSEVGGVVLFLLAMMGIIESIDKLNGFAVLLRLTHVFRGDLQRLMLLNCVLTFGLSSVMDNLTTTLFMQKLLYRTVPHEQAWRKHCGGLIVLAANAGGSWSAIGDVTTTMLWIAGKISALKIMASVFLPSVLVALIPLAGISWQARSVAVGAAAAGDVEAPVVAGREILTFVAGMLCVCLAPLLKMTLSLEPYMGMLLGLGLFWILADVLGILLPPKAMSDGFGDRCDGDRLGDSIAAVVTPAALIGAPAARSHPEQASAKLRDSAVASALREVDLMALLFFTGLVFGVRALETCGALNRYAAMLSNAFGSNKVALMYMLGISSSVVDNVPLVAAAQEMYADVPADDPLWYLLALAAGTGGSILSIGSAPGVVLMGLENVDILWYCRWITPWALLSYSAGILAYLVQLEVVKAVGGH
eukprot:TRINITY_DN4828_c3_g1_i6.p1 TRINITY_DN4828_c3_g1~~TRINITY_DN4828_c3_g1_i6.p1  ORF type:complete len:589 (+),score=157.63 TRINITY_DN4828_c3_g1_i6:46-1812(+)